MPPNMQLKSVAPRVANSDRFNQRGRLTLCYVGKTVACLANLLILTPLTYADVMQIDKAGILQIADDAAYLETRFQPGELERDSDFFTVICSNSDNWCSAHIKYRIVSSIQRTTKRKEDGTCWEDIDYETVRVQVNEDGSYRVEVSGSSGSGSNIGCELLDPPT